MCSAALIRRPGAGTHVLGVRRVVITGTNRGLGFETARQLGRSRITTIIGARDAAKGEQAARDLRDEGIDAHSLELDITSTSSVEAAAKRILEEHGVLDILIDSAGILPEGRQRPRARWTWAMFRETFETNVFGAVSVIREFLPLLRAADAGRIVNVSSTMGLLADQGDPSSPYYALGVSAYRISKLALNGITVALVKHLEDTSTRSARDPSRPISRPATARAPPSTPEEGSQIVVAMATIGDDGPNGRFVDRNGTLPW